MCVYVCVGGGGGEASTASQTTVLHMKRLSQTESPIFVILCVLCFQRQPFLTFIDHMMSSRITVFHLRL